MQRRLTLFMAPQLDKLAVRIQRCWRAYSFRKKVKISRKQRLRRHRSIQQLFTTEQSYCNHLRFMMRELLGRIEGLDQDINQLLFGRLAEIIKMHTSFLHELQQGIKDYNHFFFCLSVPLNQLFGSAHFKQIYTDYCSSFGRVAAAVKLLASNEACRQAVKKVGGFDKLESLLIKPVQRLCKYGLLLNVYLKNMNQIHPDYSALCQTVNIIDVVVRETNYDVQIYLLAERHREVAEIYPFLAGNRKLLHTRENIRLIKMIREESIPFKEIILFTDCIFLIPRPCEMTYNKSPRRSMLRHSSQEGGRNSQLDHMTSSRLGSETADEGYLLIRMDFVRDLPNFKYFKNLVQVIDAENYCTFEFKNENEKKQFLKKYHELQAAQDKELDKERGQKPRGSRHEYITVQVLGTEKRQGFLQSYTVYIVQTQRHCVKTINYPRFRQLIRLQEMIAEQGININVPALHKESLTSTFKSKTIEKRKIHLQEFMERVLNSQECRGHPVISTLISKFYFEGRKSSGYLAPHSATRPADFLPDASLNSACDDKQDQLFVLLPNFQKIRLLLRLGTCKIATLKLVIASELCLKHPEQFQIFEIRNRNITARKLIPEEQPLRPIYEQQNSVISSLNPFADSVQLIYYRHYYVSDTDEASLYLKDEMRAELEIAVIRSDLQSYCLSEDLMLAFLCLFAVYLSVDVANSSALTKFIKDVTKKEYRIEADKFREYYVHVEKLIKDTPLSSLIIKVMAGCPLYKCQQFEVQIHYKCFKQFKEQIKGLQNQKIILGLKRDSILVLNCDKKPIISFSYEQISGVQVHPNGISIKINSYSPEFRVKTQRSFEISQIIRLYSIKSD